MVNGVGRKRKKIKIKSGYSDSTYKEFDVENRKRFWLSNYGINEALDLVRWVEPYIYRWGCDLGICSGY